MSARAPRRPRARGFSLIELLVSMAIALVVTLAIAGVMIRGEGARRSTGSVNEVEQTGAYLAYVLDRHLRNAGSGFSQRWADAFGCALNVTKSGTLQLPRAAAIAVPTGSTNSPFANAPLAYRLAPVLIQDSAADVSSDDVRGDVLTVMAGTAGFGEAPLLVTTGSVTANAADGQFRLANSLGFKEGDLLLLADAGVAQGCMAEQVDTLPTPPVAGQLPLGGAYYQQAASGVALASFGAGTTYAIQLGNVSSSGTNTNPPQFTTYGVGDHTTLYGYDLLATGANDAPVPIADGVVEMRALYGIDTSSPPDGTLDRWVLPSASGYTLAELTDGSDTARRALRSIVAIRLGFVLRTSLAEKDPVARASDTLTLFGDLDAGLQRTRTLTDAERHHRFRTVEVTVPLRNVLSAPSS